MQSKINDLNKQVATLTKKNKNKSAGSSQLPLLTPINKVTPTDKTPSAGADKTDSS